MIHLKDKLEQVYSDYNKREYVNPDPLLFLYNYPEKKNREIAGFIGACLAYGRVESIMETVAGILDKLGTAPFDYLMTRTKNDMANDFKGFRYRFASDVNLVNLLWGIRDVLKRFSSLENCFCAGMSPENKTVIPGLVFFVEQIRKNKEIGHLLADPQKKSACKRSLLFLRWMVRRDGVDPGGWEKINPSLLIVPLDTHMHKIGRMLEFTKRKSQDMKTALEITKGFKRILKQDPVKYDFCLTRFGIRKGLSIDDLQHFIYT